ncbi:MAG: NitT/TauT family transport system substrate-binding protein [Candidatus Binatota bacterium]|nr:NitT/TauT family transport system substrate-binding protein [Candidatus Binatota bacterium]
MTHSKASGPAMVLTLAVVALVLQVSAAPAAAKIAISFAGMNPRQTPLWIAQEQGFFAKHGVDADVVYIRTGPIQVAAVSSGATQIAYAGAASTLGAVGSGTDLRAIASFTNKLTYALMARPEIKKAEDLRGRRLGVQAIGGSVWMGAVLALEYLGLDARRDNINILSIGDQTVAAQALEAGTIDATPLDGVFSRKLKQKGFSVVAELADTKIPYVSNIIIGSRARFQQQPELAENLLKALVESLAFILAPANKAAVINTIMKRLRISDAAVAEQGYRDLVQVSDQKPYVSIEGMRNIQRLVKIHNPVVANVKIEDLIDNRPLKKLEENGFLQRTYNAYGVGK